jgi:uncharacterized protein YuzE
MAKTLTSDLTQSIFQAIPLLLHFPTSRFWVDYDKPADVLYISFERPQQATDTEMNEDGVLYRYREDKLVGLTVLEASSRT